MTRIPIVIDGQTVEAERGSTVAAVLLDTGIWGFRSSVQNEPRGPVCGMGICFECRVTIDGVHHRRACMELCRAGMEIETGG
ncbi:MAG: (2Fe-2S)-binding protein [Acidobacteria bacterium]|nr:MAG: (2Fe-2S)-binding protein [Acidobacteriota bacterium]